MNTHTQVTDPDAAPFRERVPYEACPLCGSASISHEHTGDCSRHPSWQPPLSPTINWMRCGDCGHGFTDGYYTPEALGLVFQRIQTNQKPGQQVEKNRELSASLVEKVLPYKNLGGWLDVGFGNGSLLFTAQEYGFDVTGLDLRQSVVDDMRALGFDAHCQDICDAQDIGTFDVVSMADVLEHTPFPMPVLQAAHGMLNDAGVLFLSMPNADAFLWRSLNEANSNPYWAEMEHYHNFGRARLYDLLRQVGFEPLRYGISLRYRCGMEIVAQKV